MYSGRSDTSLRKLYIIVGGGFASDAELARASSSTEFPADCSQPACSVQAILRCWGMLIYADGRFGGWRVKHLFASERERGREEQTLDQPDFDRTTWPSRPGSLSKA